MDIVDTQVHLNKLGTLAAGLAAMEALGIAAVLYDEFDDRDEHRHLLPGQMLPNGAWRPVCPQAEAAALRHPDRIGVLRRLERRDPDVETTVRRAAAAPYTNVLRIALFDKADFEAFAAGEFSDLFAIAERYDLPMVVLAPGCMDHLRPYVERFPELRFVIDHCGVPLQRSGQGVHFDTVLKLSRYKNVYLKWAHAPVVFSAESYPFADVIPLLQRALAAFGRERIMWASDFTQSAKLFSWAETLFYLRHTTELSEADKEWILGRTARNIYRWPKAATA